MPPTTLSPPSPLPLPFLISPTFPLSSPWIHKRGECSPELPTEQVHLQLASYKHKNVPSLESSVNLAHFAICLHYVVNWGSFVEMDCYRILAGVDLHMEGQVIGRVLYAVLCGL